MNNFNDEKILSNLSLGHKINSDYSYTPSLNNGQKFYQTLTQNNLKKQPYNPKFLERVPRSLNRQKLTINTQFFGYDCWHMFELSYLNPKGLPQVMIGEMYVPCTSEYIVESKSLKLYLNSFNMTVLGSNEDFKNIITKDISALLECEVTIKLYSRGDWQNLNCQELPGLVLENESSLNNPALENQVIEPIVDFEVTPNLIKQSSDNTEISETLVSHLLRSNCLVTGQPDWGTIVIKYTGAPLDHDSLLRYLVSYRIHKEFHEHCVERIFTDLENHTKLSFLDVQAYYTRRGGLDINPRRCSQTISYESKRLVRQ